MPTQANPKPPPLDGDTDRAIEQLGLLAKRLLHTVRISNDPVELTPTQWVVLTNLESGPVRVGALATIMGTAQNTVSEIVGRLQRSGFVSKTGDPKDRRAVLVVITEKGAVALKRRRSAMVGAHRMVLGGLSVEDRKRFLEAFALLVEMVERARESVDRSQIEAQRSK
jgi:DNA-binding MarR family transcriptional regulator